MPERLDTKVQEVFEQGEASKGQIDLPQRTTTLERLDAKILRVLAQRTIPERDSIGHIKRALATGEDSMTIDSNLLLHAFQGLIDAKAAVLVLNGDGKKYWQLASPENQAQQTAPTLPLQQWPRPGPPPKRPVPSATVPVQPVMPMLTRQVPSNAKSNPQHANSKVAQLEQLVEELRGLLKERTRRVKDLNGKVANARKAQAGADQRANELAVQLTAAQRAQAGADRRANELAAQLTTLQAEQLTVLSPEQDLQSASLAERLKVCYSILFKRQLPNA